MFREITSSEGVSINQLFHCAKSGGFSMDAMYFAQPTGSYKAFRMDFDKRSKGVLRRTIIESVVMFHV